MAKPKGPKLWSCDERDRSECRNSHGCHCREIEFLHERLTELTRTFKEFIVTTDLEQQAATKARLNG